MVFSVNGCVGSSTACLLALLKLYDLSSEIGFVDRPNHYFVHQRLYGYTMRMPRDFLLHGHFESAIPFPPSPRIERSFPMHATAALALSSGNNKLQSCLSVVLEVQEMRSYRVTAVAVLVVVVAVGQESR